MKLPDELYVQVEGKGDDEFINAHVDPRECAIAGEVETAVLYRKVGTVRITAEIEIIRPKK